MRSDNLQSLVMYHAARLLRIYLSSVSRLPPPEPPRASAHYYCAIGRSAGACSRARARRELCKCVFSELRTRSVYHRARQIANCRARVRRRGGRPKVREEADFGSRVYCCGEPSRFIFIESGLPSRERTESKGETYGSVPARK